MNTGVDPVWTEAPSSVSMENPLGITNTRNLKLFDDLVFPLQSDSITYRLRYVSFWAWVLDSIDDPDKKARAQYEKIFFLSNIAHDCPDDGHSSNGIVGATRRSNGSRLSDRYDPDADTFIIGDEDFALSKSGGSGFDLYYQTIMQNLWFISEKKNLTPLGEKLAMAYDDAVNLNFNRLREAVNTGEVSHAVVQQLSQNGCCCQLRHADPERKVLIHALLGNFSKVDYPSKLSFNPEIGPDKLSIESWYSGELQKGGDVTINLESVSDTEKQTDLAEYFERRFDARSRASCILLLSASGRVDTTSPKSGLTLPVIEDIKYAWEFFVHTHYFVVASEVLLKAWLHGLRDWGPITTDNLLQELFDGKEYVQILQRLLQGDITVSVDDSSDDQLWRVLDAIYYDSWFEGSLDVTLPPPETGNSTTCDSLTCGELINRLPVAVDDKGHMTNTSGRVLHDLVQSGLGQPSDAITARALAAVATVMFAQLFQRGQKYQTNEKYKPYRQWFDHIASSPSPSSLWQSNFEDIAVADFMKSYTEKEIVTRHWKITQDKIHRNASSTPRHMLRQPNGRWEFKSMYKTRRLSQSWARLERLTDTLYDLNLISAADLDQFRPNADGRTLLKQYGVDL